MSGITLEEYKRAYRKLMIEKEKRGFAMHLIVYAAVNSVLIAYNLLVDPEVMWFIFPLVGWSICLASHYFGDVRIALKHLEKDELKAERMARGEAA